MANNRCLCIYCLIFGIIFGLLLLAFLGVFVGIPLIYKKSPESQRQFIFPTGELTPLKPEFSNLGKYGLSGARNAHVSVSPDNSISLGVWHILPQALINSSNQPNFDYSYSLATNHFPIVIHFHENTGNRAKYTPMYHVLRNFFHIIAFDYRGYGDSSKQIPKEEGIVEDSVRLYKWLRAQTLADIYFWGHGIGSALSTHTMLKLREMNIVPKGLFLEAPFTSMRDQIQETDFYKVFKWVPWYKSSMLDPLEKNGFIFDTNKYIKSVDCPIMIVHATDDSITPYSFSERLHRSAEEHRRRDQGNVTLHLLPENLYCDHEFIYRAPDLLRYITNHIDLCKSYPRTRG